MNQLTDLTSPDSLSLTIDQKDKFDFEGEENPRPQKFIEILNKKENKRTPIDIEYLILGLFKLNIFCKPLIPHLLHWKGIIEKIIPYLNLEFFPAGTPIIHYGHHITNLYILCSGQAKEFVAKSAHQMQKETQANALKIQTVINLVNTDYYAAPSPLTSSPAKRLGKLVSFSSKKEGRSPLRLKDKETSFDNVNLSFKKMSSLGSTKTNSDVKPRIKLLKEGRNQREAQEVSEFINEKGVTRQIWEAFKANRENYFSEDILKVKASRVFSEGSNFGIASLDNSKVKTCAVVASEDSYCLSLKQEDLKRIVDQEVALHAYKIEFFCDLFPEINKYKLVEFALPWEEQYFQVNEGIFQQGEESEHLYVIMSGEIVLSRDVKNVEKEKNLYEEASSAKKKNAQDYSFKIAKVCEGNFFGEEDFFRNCLREMTATVCSPRARILRLDKLSCNSLSERLQEIIYQIKEKTVSKAIWNRKRLQDLYVQNVPHKETAADSYLDLKGSMFNVLCQKAKNMNLGSGTIPKIKQFSPLKKTPLLTSYEIVSELHQKHPKLMNFITQQQMKFSRPRERSAEALPKVVSTPPVVEKTVDLDAIRPDDWMPFTRSRRPQITIVTEKNEDTQRWGSSKSIAINSQFDELEASKGSIIVKDLNLSKELNQSKDLLQSQISSSAARGFPNFSKSTTQMIQARKARTLGSSFKNRSSEVRKYLNRAKESPSREVETVLVESSETLKNFDPILITAIDYESKKATKETPGYSPHLNLSKGAILGYSIIDNFSGNSHSNKKGLSEMISPLSVGSFGGLTNKSFKITGRKHMSPLQRSELKDSQDRILI